MLRFVGFLTSLVFVSPAFAQDPQVGDTTVLVERDIHIPAHLAPGDTDVPFRFASGSTATVLAVDATTGLASDSWRAVGRSDAW